MSAKKSGDNWYWLDSEEGGAMATNKLIDDDSDIYYVDGNGIMVRNTWVKVVNEDQDDEDDPAEYNYYYMQSSGKAYKASQNPTATRFKAIDGKKTYFNPADAKGNETILEKKINSKTYGFNEKGVMVYEWTVATSGDLSSTST